MPDCGRGKTRKVRGSGWLCAKVAEGAGKIFHELKILRGTKRFAKGSRKHKFAGCQNKGGCSGPQKDAERFVEGFCGSDFLRHQNLKRRKTIAHITPVSM